MFIYLMPPTRLKHKHLELFVFLITGEESFRGRWQCRRTLGSPPPVDHLDSTYTSLNNPENHQKTSRTDSLEPSIDKRPRKRVGRAERRCMLHGLAGGSQGRGAASRQSIAEPPSLACKSGGAIGGCSDSKQDLTSGR